MRNAAATVRVVSAATSPMQRHLAGLEQRVAVVERGDHQVMQVGGEDQRDAEHGEEIADDHALLALRRIDRGDEAEPQLLGDHRARDLQRRDRQPRGEAEHRADQHLLRRASASDRPERAQIDLIGVAVQRQQHRRQHQRDGEPHPHRHAHFAEPRQQHHHGADAREHQHEGRGERGQEGDVDCIAHV